MITSHDWGMCASYHAPPPTYRRENTTCCPHDVMQAHQCRAAALYAWSGQRARRAQPHACAQQAFQYAYSCYKTDAAQSYSQPCFNGQAGWTQDLAGNLLVPANTWAGTWLSGWDLTCFIGGWTVPLMYGAALIIK
jgi:hypothetical protein